MDRTRLAELAVGIADALRAEGIASLILEPHGGKLRVFARDAAGNPTDVRVEEQAPVSASMTLPQPPEAEPSAEPSAA